MAAAADRGDARPSREAKDGGAERLGHHARDRDGHEPGPQRTAGRGLGGRRARRASRAARPRQLPGAPPSRGRRPRAVRMTDAPPAVRRRGPSTSPPRRRPRPGGGVPIPDRTATPSTTAFHGHHGLAASWIPNPARPDVLGGGATVASSTIQPAPANETSAPGIHRSERSAANRAATAPRHSQGPMGPPTETATESAPRSARQCAPAPDRARPPRPGRRPGRRRPAPPGLRRTAPAPARSAR